jgi:hypothetical protein
MNCVIGFILFYKCLVVEEAGIPGENHDHGEATGKLDNLWLQIKRTLSCNLQRQARTHAVLVMTPHYGSLANDPFP